MYFSARKHFLSTYTIHNATIVVILLSSYLVSKIHTMETVSLYVVVKSGASKHKMNTL